MYNRPSGGDVLPKPKKESTEEPQKERMGEGTALAVLWSFWGHRIQVTHKHTKCPLSKTLYPLGHVSWGPKFYLANSRRGILNGGFNLWEQNDVMIKKSLGNNEAYSRFYHDVEKWISEQREVLKKLREMKWSCFLFIHFQLPWFNKQAMSVYSSEFHHWSESYLKVRAGSFILLPSKPVN